MKKIVLFCVIVAISYSLAGQTYTGFTQFFVNPYIINPSYAGIEGRPFAALTYRNQWVGIADSPKIYNLTFHTPVKAGLSLGGNISNDRRGILNTSELKMTTGYTVSVTRNTALRFGLSIGAAFENLDLERADNPDDPALLQAAGNSASLTGNAGISLTSGPFQLGIAIPRIFKYKALNTQTFNVQPFDAFESILFNTSYRFQLPDPRFFIQTDLLYRLNNALPDQWEAAFSVYMHDLVWIGGSYRQSFGYSAFGGVNLAQKFGIGYGYSIKPSDEAKITQPTHEIQLLFSFGKRKKRYAANSFVTTIPSQEIVEGKGEEISTVAKKPNSESENISEPEPPPAARIRPEIRQPLTRQALDSMELVRLRFEKRKQVLIDDPVQYKKGDHAQELSAGEFIVTGSFKNEANAKRYCENITKSYGYEAAYGYQSEAGIWYVYVKKYSNRFEAIGERDKIRQNAAFQEVWILTVVE